MLVYQSNLILVLDCSGSMVSMPVEGVTKLKQILADIPKVDEELTKMTVILFGSTITSENYPLSERQRFNWTTWRHDLGQTALFDAVTSAVDAAGKLPTLMMIVTDGDENYSKTTALEVKKNVAEFQARSVTNKIMLIGPGTKEKFENLFGKDIDVYPLDPAEGHQGICRNLASPSYQAQMQECFAMNQMEARQRQIPSAP